MEVASQCHRSRFWNGENMLLFEESRTLESTGAARRRCTAQLNRRQSKFSGSHYEKFLTSQDHETREVQIVGMHTTRETTKIDDHLMLNECIEVLFVPAEMENLLCCHFVSSCWRSRSRGVRAKAQERKCTSRSAATCCCSKRKPCQDFDDDVHDDWRTPPPLEPDELMSAHQGVSKYEEKKK